jgi:hypothetical protein
LKSAVKTDFIEKSTAVLHVKRVLVTTLNLPPFFKKAWGLNRFGLTYRRRGLKWTVHFPPQFRKEFIRKKTNVRSFIYHSVTFPQQPARFLICHVVKGALVASPNIVNRYLFR